MIYHLHEFQKTLMTPTVLLADTVKHLFTSPFSPLAYTPVSRAIAANSEVFVRLMRRYPKPQWRVDHTIIDGESIAVTRRLRWTSRFANSCISEKTFPSTSRNC